MNSIQNGMAKDEIKYELINEVPCSDVMEDLLSIYNLLFNDADDDFFRMRIKSHADLLIIIARHGDRVIGFKIGYPILDQTFYSWIGGIDPEFRRRGIGNRLAEIQEKWAREKGFKQLKTKSMNRFKPMMMLNLKRGFDITKVYTNDKGQTKIVFYKSIA